MMGLVTLPLDGGPKWDVRQWIAWWSGFHGGSSSREKLLIFSYHSFHTYRTWKSKYFGRFLQLSDGEQAAKGWDHFYGEADP